MSSLKKQNIRSVKECPCKNCQDIKHIGYYYPDYVVELTKKINELDIARNKEIKEVEFEIKKGKNVSYLILEIENIKKNYDYLVNSISEGYFCYHIPKMPVKTLCGTKK